MRTILPALLVVTTTLVLLAPSAAAHPTAVVVNSPTSYKRCYVFDDWMDLEPPTFWMESNGVLTGGEPTALDHAYDITQLGPHDGGSGLQRFPVSPQIPEDTQLSPDAFAQICGS